MSSQSFYRKWRSQTFEDVVGQAHVTRTLRNALQLGRVAHAYLFCGPRGVGKTSVARILAKGINCLQPREGEPCNECRMCSAITEGRALDVIEVDAASNRRIEEMRDLRDKVNFAPSDGRYKVYILDEAHMLTHEASNALLKTLEEPPAHTVFVLITTEAHKIPDTIVSRCQRFNFRRIVEKESVERLNLVCEREGLSVAPEALALVARAATGSLRDAEGLLDQLVAYCGRDISAAQVQDVLGLAGEAAITQLGEHLIAGDLGRGLELIGGVAEHGADLHRFAEDFVGYLRSILVVKSGADVAVLPNVGGEHVALLRQAAQRLALDDLVSCIRIFVETETGARGTIAPQLALELSFAEAVLHLGRDRAPAPRTERPATTGPREQRIGPAARLDAAAGDRAGNPVVAPATSPRERSAPSRPAAPASGDSETMIRSSSPLPAPSGSETNAIAESREALLAQLRRQWDSEVVETLGAANKPLQALLRSCRPYEVRGDAVVVGCQFAFHRSRLEEADNCRLLEERVAHVLGRRVPLQFEIASQQKRGDPSPLTNDPLIKEVLSWGGRIKAVVTSDETSDVGPEGAVEGVDGQRLTRERDAANRRKANDES